MNTKSYPRPFIFFSLLLVVHGPPATAQNVRSIAEHEIARRQAGVVQGQAALERGKLALQTKDFARAHDEFRVAVSFLPDALTTAAEHEAAVAGFAKAR